MHVLGTAILDRCSREAPSRAKNYLSVAAITENHSLNHWFVRACLSLNPLSPVVALRQRLVDADDVKVIDTLLHQTVEYC